MVQITYHKRSTYSPRMDEKANWLLLHKADWLDVNFIRMTMISVIVEEFPSTIKQNFIGDHRKRTDMSESITKIPQ